MGSSADKRFRAKGRYGSAEHARDQSELLSWMAGIHRRPASPDNDRELSPAGNFCIARSARRPVYVCVAPDPGRIDIVPGVRRFADLVRFWSPNKACEPARSTTPIVPSFKEGRCADKSNVMLPIDRRGGEVQPLSDWNQRYKYESNR